MHLNVEIKARSNKLDVQRAALLALGARSTGTDHQLDTYYHVPSGRLKLRTGSIENALIYYERADQAGPKQSNIAMYAHPHDPALGALLAQALGVWVVVDKRREIFWIDNVKFHLDTVQGLGTFVEIEAVDYDASLGADKLHQQCTHYLDVLQIAPTDLLAQSYSDMLMQQQKRAQ